MAELQSFLQGEGLGLVPPLSQKTLPASFKTREEPLRSLGPGPSLPQLNRWSLIRILPPAPSRIPEPVLSSAHREWPLPI